MRCQTSFIGFEKSPFGLLFYCCAVLCGHSSVAFAFLPGVLANVTFRRHGLSFPGGGKPEVQGATAETGRPHPQYDRQQCEDRVQVPAQCFRTSTEGYRTEWSVTETENMWIKGLRGGAWMALASCGTDLYDLIAYLLNEIRFHCEL